MKSFKKNFKKIEKISKDVEKLSKDVKKLTDNNIRQLNRETSKDLHKLKNNTVEFFDSLKINKKKSKQKKSTNNVEGLSNLSKDIDLESGSTSEIDDDNQDDDQDHNQDNDQDNDQDNCQGIKPDINSDIKLDNDQYIKSYINSDTDNDEQIDIKHLEFEQMDKSVGYDENSKLQFDLTNIDFNSNQHIKTDEYGFMLYDETNINNQTEQNYIDLLNSEESSEIDIIIDCNENELLNVEKINSHDSNSYSNPNNILTDNILTDNTNENVNSTEKNIQTEISLMGKYHRNYLINQINNVYSYPLLPIIEDTEYKPNQNHFLSNSSVRSVLRKGYWDRKIGKVHRVKFLCHVCGKVPEGFKGYRVHLINGWAKTTLQTFALSLNILQVALTVAGVNNGISEIGKLALRSFDTIQSDLLKNKIDGISSEELEQKRKQIEHTILQKEEEAQGGFTDVLQEDIQYVPVNADYIRGIKELFEALNEKEHPRNCGLVCVTRSEDFECAWVCVGSTQGVSSSCYKKFQQSKKLNSLIRFVFE
jgi:hypothetical protein